jgi:hypothetical protein
MGAAMVNRHWPMVNRRNGATGLLFACTSDLQGEGLVGWEAIGKVRKFRHRLGWY